MRVRVDDLGAWIENHHDFARFDLATDLDNDELDRMLRGADAGRWDGDHGWIRRSWIRESVDDASHRWNEQFEEMIGYAARQGWVSADGEVRVHRNR
ncbi:hypothetical protein [Microbacterium yannicii]|uniref:hypothetical protein n=1 Tax=Microbacterium yannicii TaxID=671622 RepID=UPI0003001677|nr:hypothetical protein [Microbacterium yannicii]